MESKFIGICKDLNEYGQGIVYYDNNMIVVDNLLVNEEAEIIITKKTYKYYLGRVYKYIKTSKDRNVVHCNSKCGGCDLIHLNYPLQIEYKAKQFNELFAGYNILNFIHADNNYHYRNKVQAAFGRTKSGKIISGVYQSGSHRIVSVDSCMTEDKIADEIIVDIRNMLPKFKIWTYDEDRGTGFLRHVLVKRGFTSGEVMVVLVGASGFFPMKKKFTTELLRKHPEITTVVLNVNDKFTSLVLGKQEKVLFGKGYIEDICCGCRFRISAKSFLHSGMPSSTP